MRGRAWELWLSLEPIRSSRRAVAYLTMYLVPATIQDFVSGQVLSFLDRLRDHRETLNMLLE